MLKMFDEEWRKLEKITQKNLKRNFFMVMILNRILIGIMLGALASLIMFVFRG